MIDGRPDLTDAFECNGYFWLDETPANVVAGSLRYHPERGSSLELLGQLDPLKIEIGTIELLRGVSSTNDKLTLLNCRPQRTQLQQGLFAIQHFSCEVALLGNFHPEPTLTFRKSGVRFDKLDHWLKLDYVKTDRVSKGEMRGGLSIAVSTGSQGVLECEQGGYEVKLEADFSSTSNGYKAEVNTYTTMYIKPEIPKDLRWFFNEGDSLRDFAALCFGSPLPLRSVKMLDGDVLIEGAITMTKFVSAFFVEQAPATPSRASFPLIMFRRLEHSAPNILSAWNDKRDIFQEVVD